MNLSKQCLMFFLILILVGCNKAETESKDQGITDTETTSKPLDEMTVVAEKLDIPWSIQKEEDTFYISERNGTIAVIENGKSHRENILLKKVLSSQPEAGLLGFVLSSDFKQSQQAFAYYTYDQEGESFNRIIVLKRENHRWKEIRTLLDKIPSGQYHHGGRMKIGHDHKLYITVGDALNEERAQNISSLNGKILRMKLDGTIPEDNPFPNSYVYSYGHRNSQGLVWNENGQLYSSEHGPSAHDEINLITPGNNYGWPIIKGDEAKTNMQNPLIHSGKDTWAPSGIAYYKKNLYIAMLRGESVKRFDIQSKVMHNVVTGVGRIRDVFIEGDYLYFITNNTDGRGVPKPEDDKLYMIKLSETS
ncbi:MULTISPECIES: PQQ-dependent sugar dehydrogenase [Bacillus]|uniref:PQQ-dependent sugar dehydrogenase n=1 Tax=Bacillus TaxID=1386 RepID=UPI0002F077F3|nr:MULTISPECIES: PQQ-dependent sugar dehydrogenase [Bacillus]